jgi:hypothetical protein
VGVENVFCVYSSLATYRGLRDEVVGASGREEMRS